MSVPSIFIIFHIEPIYADKKGKKGLFRQYDCVVRVEKYTAFIPCIFAYENSQRTCRITQVRRKRQTNNRHIRAVENNKLQISAMTSIQCIRTMWRCKLCILVSHLLKRWNNAVWISYDERCLRFDVFNFYDWLWIRSRKYCVKKYMVTIYKLKTG